VLQAGRLVKLAYSSMQFPGDLAVVYGSVVPMRVSIWLPIYYPFISSVHTVCNRFDDFRTGTAGVGEPPIMHAVDIGFYIQPIISNN
jgi:hypothetical protein